MKSRCAGNDVAARQHAAYAFRQMNDPLAKRQNAPNVSLVAEPITFSTADFVKTEILGLWPGFQSEQRHQPANEGICYAPPLEPHERDRIRALMEETLEPARISWMLGMTKDFRKAIREIDRKLQGRILEAINDISENPVQPNGDTVKPLSGDMKAFWRYRIGDYRLVYLPDREKHQITLWTFAARGGVYD
jgi:mRNA-degrading endonuclease RelE of RelBE toxin-antitoxin system